MLRRRGLERKSGTPIVGVPRAVLHRLLREALPPECLVIGTEVTSLDCSDPGRARMPIEEGVLDADLVVAADGVDSRLRGRLFPRHPGPVYAGSTVLRAVTEHPVTLATDFELTWGEGAEFGHIAFADGRAERHAVLNSPPAAAALATEPTVEAALIRYDAERRPRTEAVARAARQAGRMGRQLAHPLAVAQRDTALRLAPPA